MALATVETNKSVSAFIDSVENESKREDAKKLVKIFEKVTGKKAKVWGDNFIIGFGKYKYTRKDKKEEYEWFNTGFAPRKSNITLYFSYYVSDDPLLKKLGKYTVGKGCLYIKKLDDVDLEILEKLIEKGKVNAWHS